ncbi:hypothetical protein BBBGCB_BBBGCB_15235, partial [Dysosmobacter welbionis]
WAAGPSGSWRTSPRRCCPPWRRPRRPAGPSPPPRCSRCPRCSSWICCCG